ncbi:MOSC domain-containing protein [Paenibacillus herberti]|nr:MOSC domain-containing protein [Paenibacillus herberti]
MKIGVTEAIWRYPVKSMGGERLEQVAVESYGLLGDRFCSFYDEAKQGWNSYHTARKLPGLLLYQASYTDEGIKVKSPHGGSFSWDSQLQEELEQVTGIRMSMSVEGEAGREDNSLKSVDAASILLITDASLRRLKEKWGKEVDPLRFRPNLFIGTDDPQLDENDLIGAQLRIGNALVQVNSFCERCSMITCDPESLERDPSLLRSVNESFGLKFGLYASVLEPGTIAVGDTVIRVS